ncbi:MAG: hypothetical protein NTW49_10630 [Bacteroidia bacterium]|nr:hypothetical protein [Bacteroidia bacterium]
MKDKIEQFITENREKFDIYEPAPGLWNKIISHQRRVKLLSLNWNGLIWKAAILVVVFFSAFLSSEYMHRAEYSGKEAAKTAGLNDARIKEFQKAEQYYSTMVNDRLKEVQKYTSNNPEINKELNYDLKELDNVYSQLKKDLKDNIANKEVIEALIQNYRLRLQVLEDILNKFHDFDNAATKDEKHEI